MSFYYTPAPPAVIWILIGCIFVLLVLALTFERNVKREDEKLRKELQSFRKMAALKDVEISLLRNINIELEQQVEIQKEVVKTQDALIDCQRRTVDQIRQLG